MPRIPTTQLRQKMIAHAKVIIIPRHRKDIVIPDQVFNATNLPLCLGCRWVSWRCRKPEVGGHDNNSFGCKVLKLTKQPELVEAKRVSLLIED